MSQDTGPDLFGETAKQITRLEVLPVSVVETARQHQSRRREGQHDTVSSRADYSHFPFEVGDLAYRLFLRDRQQVFDPFAGWGERHALARTYGTPYIGYDINAGAIATAKSEYGVTNTLADSRVAPLPVFDALLTCPPYWGLEHYSDAGIENAETFDLFCDQLAQVFDRCYDAAQVGARFCVLVGDWRADHVYYDLSFRVSKMFDELGATPHDTVVISRRSTAKIKIMVPQAVRLGYTVKVHEALLVFDKR